MNLITGHNLIQPKAIDAPLEFTMDADLVARTRVGLIVMKAKRDALEIVPERGEGVINASDIGLSLADLEDAA